MDRRRTTILQARFGPTPLASGALALIRLVQDIAQIPDSPTGRAAVMFKLALSRGLTAKTRNAALHLTVLISGFAMNDVVDRILNAYLLKRPLDPERIADSRMKISGYLESLASAGQRDAKKLAIYGLAYLTELHEGRDPWFTGC